jgi:hypothetical protein
MVDMLGFSTPGAQALLDALNGSQPRINHAPYSGSDAGLVAWAVDVAAAGRNVDDNERRILSKFAAQCGVSPEQLDRMINAAIGGRLEVPQPADPTQARTWLKAMAATVQAGGTITPDGLALFRTLGSKVGMGDYDIKELIRQARAEQYAAASAALRSAKNSN